MEGDGVQVLVESSWNVLQGSLDNCVTVVFLDPQTHDPIISASSHASEKLVLVPPTESVPCEITVKFQGRLCHLQSFYTLSTARIYELYSQSRLEADRDYVCTVKAWIPYDSSYCSAEGTEMVLGAADSTHRNGMQETNFNESNMDESVLSSVGSSTVALHPAIDVKSVYSSSDDSWVDVRLHGSFTSENACVNLPATKCDNWHVPLDEHEVVHLEDRLFLGRLGSKVKDMAVEGDSKLDECCEGEVQCKDYIVQGNAQQEFFEAELELVDQDPWVAITIRLLSLQNKSLVEVDQMVFLAVSGPVPEPGSPCRSADQGAKSLFAMFLPSMLQTARGVSDNSESILKCQSSSHSCEQAQDMIDKLPSENVSQSCEPAQEESMGKLSAGGKQIGVASLQNVAAEKGFGQQQSQHLAAHFPTHAAGASIKAGSLLNLGGDQVISQQSNSEFKGTGERGGDEEISQQSNSEFKGTGERGGDEEISQQSNSNGSESKRTVEIGGDQEISQQSDSNGAVSKRTAEIGGDQEISQESDSNGAEPKRTVKMSEHPFLSDSNVMPRCNCQNLAGDVMTKDLVSTLNAFSERFDRLESLCLRMESYLQKTFENLDQRILHLEAQHRKGSEEADYVSASLEQSSMSVEEPVMQHGHNDQESPPSSMQYTAPSDLPSISEHKEGVPISFTKSAEQGCSEAHNVFNEVPKPILFDVVHSDSVVAEKLVKDAPSESQKLSRGPATMVGCLSKQNKRACVSLDDAWASALSAFATSFTPVVESENTVADWVDEQPSDSSEDTLISVLQESEALRKERNSSKATSHCGVECITDLTNPANCDDANSEAVSSEDGPINEDFAEAPCDARMPTAHALPISVSLQKPDSLLSIYSSSMSTSVPIGTFDFLGLREMQSMPSKARTEVNNSLEDIDLATTQVFSGLSQDGLSACPLFDVFASARSHSTPLREPKDNLPDSGGFKAGLSPVFDSASSEMQDVDFVSVGTRSNNFSQCQESKDFLNFEVHFKEMKQDYLYSFDEEALNSNSEDTGLREFSSLFNGASKASQNKGNKEESTVDLLGNFIAREQGNVLDMSAVQAPKSFNSTSFTCSEIEEAACFPDVLDEDCSNYQDGRACSEDSLCFSQDFDICPNELFEDEWSCAPNVFYLNDPELTDDETNGAVADVDEKIEMSDASDTDSVEDLPFWPAVHSDIPQPTTVFPGFENLS